MSGNCESSVYCPCRCVWQVDHQVIISLILLTWVSKHIVSFRCDRRRWTIEDGIINSPLPMIGEWSNQCWCLRMLFRWISFCLGLTWIYFMLSAMKGHQYVLVSSVVIFPSQPAWNLSVLGSHQRNTESEDRITQWCHLSHQYREETRSGQGPNLMGLYIWDFFLLSVFIRALPFDVSRMYDLSHSRATPFTP